MRGRQIELYKLQQLTEHINFSSASSSLAKVWC